MARAARVLAEPGRALLPVAEPAVQPVKREALARPVPALAAALVREPAAVARGAVAKAGRRISVLAGLTIQRAGNNVLAL